MATSASHILQIVIKVVNKATAGLKQTENNLNRLEKSTGRINGRMLGFGLSMLFTGMALKRFAEGALRGMANTYMQLTDHTSVAHQKVMELQAGFEFLKYSIFDAIGNTELFAVVIDGLVSMFNMISQFVQTHPLVAKFIGIFLAMGIILGSVAMVLGQVSLLATGLGLTLLPLVGIIVLIGLTVAALFVLWDSDFTLMAKIIGTIITLTLAWLAGMILIGKGWSALAFGFKILGLLTNPLFWIVMALGWIVIAWYRVAKATGDFWAFGKMIFAGFLKFLVLIGKAIFDFLILPIEMVVKAIEAAAALFGVSLPGSIQTAVNAFNKLKDIEANVVYNAMDAIDKSMGMDKIREAIPNIEDPLAFIGLKPFISSGDVGSYSGEALQSEADKIGESRDKELASLDKLGGGASIKDLEDKQGESNNLLSEILQAQKEAKESQKEIKLTQETIDALSSSMGGSLGKAFEDVIRDNVTIIPSTQG